MILLLPTPPVIAASLACISTVPCTAVPVNKIVAVSLPVLVIVLTVSPLVPNPIVQLSSSSEAAATVNVSFVSVTMTLGFTAPLAIVEVVAIAAMVLSLQPPCSIEYLHLVLLF